MPTSEFVIGTFRPDVAMQGVAHLRTDMPKIFDKVPGSLSNHVANVIKLNGKDISSEHKPILGLGGSFFILKFSHSLCMSSTDK